MVASTTRSPEIALPVAALAGIRDALVEAVGADATAETLRQAGFAAGDAFHRILAADPGNDLEQLTSDHFWQRLARLFSARGWGAIGYSQPHPGVGALDAHGWVEAVPDSASQPSCYFTTGILANLLGRVSGGEVAVLEVECRSRGDLRCRFLFGGAAAVYALYDRIAAGTPADAALGELA